MMALDPHIPLVRQVAARMGVWDDDSLQEGALGLLDAARRYDGRCRFETYAAHRIRGAIRDYQRRSLPLSRWHAAKGRSVELVEFVEATADTGDPFETVAERERSERLWTAVEKLPEREREVVLLSYRYGMKLREIGRSWGRGEATACVFRASALRALAGMIGELRG